MGACWLCRYTKNKLPEPDGKPLCGRCSALLDDTSEWLRSLTTWPSTTPGIPFHWKSPENPQVVPLPPHPA